MRPFVYYILLTTLLFSSCRKDDYKETHLPNNPQTGLLIEGNITGLVTADDGTGIEGVNITLEGQTAISDKNGYFKVKGARVDEYGSLIKFKKSGYIDGFKFVYTATGSQTYQNVTLLKSAEAGSFSSATGGEVMIGEAKVLFPANAVSLNAQPYNGDVSIHAHWYNPADDKMSTSMPGDLRAISNSGEELQLATFGMVSVDLFTASGEELELTTGTEATIHFPLSNGLTNLASETIPMWTFDESTGYWNEEGSATLVGNEMVAKVTHFSFWNCDYPFPLVEIEGLLVDSNGDAIPNFPLTIKWDGWAPTGHGYTNTSGIFQGKVPKDVPLTLLAYHCGIEILNQDLGTISVDGSIGTFSTDLTNYSKPLTATLLDCFGAPLSDGYIIVSSTNSATLMIPDENGLIAESILGCGNAELTLQAFDPISEKFSSPIPIEISNDPLDLGNLAVCDEQSEFVSFSLGGGPANLINDATVQLVNNEFLHILSKGSSGNLLYDVQIPLITQGIETPLASFMTGFNGNGELEQTLCGGYIWSPSATCPNDVTITEFGAIGDFIVGSLDGFMVTDTVAMMIEIESSFNVRLDSEITTGSVSGMVWSDANNNGIREPSEVPVANVNLYLVDENGIRPSNDKFYPSSFRNMITTKADGTYSFDGLVDGNTYYVLMNNTSLYNITLPNEGGDELIDSDFIVISNIDGFVAPATLSQEGETIENLDLGLTFDGMNCSTSTVTGCIEDVIIYVNISGGLPPYQVDIEGGPALPLGVREVTDVMPGIYRFKVKDQSGLECSAQATIPETYNSISGSIWLDKPGGVDGVFDNQDEYFKELSFELLDESGTVVQYMGPPNQTLNGAYKFGALEETSFRIKPIVPVGYELVNMSVGTNPNADSDIDPLTGVSELITFTPECVERFDIWVGVKEL